jgi:hypothetical protein
MRGAVCEGVVHGGRGGGRRSRRRLDRVVDCCRCPDFGGSGVMHHGVWDGHVDARLCDGRVGSNSLSLVGTSSVFK